MGEPKLLPCPFCGGKPELRIGTAFSIDAMICCVDCDVFGPTFDNEEVEVSDYQKQKNINDAVAHWNARRAPAPADEAGKLEHERALFETFVKLSGISTDWSRDKTDESNPYHRVAVEAAWKAWQASASAPRATRRRIDKLRDMGLVDAADYAESVTQPTGDVKLESGWLRRDVERAAAQVTEWEAAAGATGKPVAWIDFADNGNIRFWTDDAARAKSEAESGRSLRAFTIENLIGLSVMSKPTGDVGELVERLRAPIPRHQPLPSSDVRSPIGADYNWAEIEAQRKQAADMLATAEAHVKELEARLEIDHFWEIRKGEKIKINVPPDQRDKMIDGIDARDQTIKIQDENIDRLRSRVAELEKMLRTIEMETRDGGQWTLADVNDAACAAISPTEAGDAR